MPNDSKEYMSIGELHDEVESIKEVCVIRGTQLSALSSQLNVIYSKLDMIEQNSWSWKKMAAIIVPTMLTFITQIIAIMA